MAVGKGSMARASKAAASKTKEVKAVVVANADEKVVEAAVEVKEEVIKAETKKTSPKKTTAKKETAKKTAAKKTAPKAEQEPKVEASAVIAATSEQVMKQIVYQKSAQVLDREPEVNETFGIGEAMPIYLF